MWTYYVHIRLCLLDCHSRLITSRVMSAGLDIVEWALEYRSTVRLGYGRRSVQAHTKHPHMRGHFRRRCVCEGRCGWEMCQEEEGHRRYATQNKFDLLPTTYYPYSLLIYTTYYLSNPSSQPASTLGRRAHFGGPVRGSPYTRGTQCRGPEAGESVSNRPAGAATWPVTRIRGVAMLTLGFWAHSENARARGIAP